MLADRQPASHLPRLLFLTPAIAGFAIFSTFLYRDVFGVDDWPGLIIGLVEGPAASSASPSARLDAHVRGIRSYLPLLSAIFFVDATSAVFAWAPALVGRGRATS